MQGSELNTMHAQSPEGALDIQDEQSPNNAYAAYNACDAYDVQDTPTVSPSVELLAPAGNVTCLHAAVQAGADAVYLGVGQFNARRGADNFSLEDLAQACDYAHLRGVKIYLTLNTIVLPSEVGDVLETARQAYRCGVDAYIVQDTGLAIELRRCIPEVEVHISTQMNIHTEEGVYAAAALGASRVTLARELSLADIAHLSDVACTLGMEVEVFGHGALCICYSGQCFMSSMVGGRSANRGRCAQACRLPYTLHNVALRKTLDAPGEHLLSPKDLCTIDLLPELIHAGISSLKIEGRMKSPEYVSSVVGTYRAVLDRAKAWVCEERLSALDCGTAQVPVAEPVNPRVTEGEHLALSEAFSRGFTTAYLEGQRGNEIMSYGRPNNRGVFIGRVVRVKDGSVVLDTDQVLHEGDVLEFWTNRGRFVHTVEKITFDKSGKVVLKADRAVGKGDRVFRVRNAEMMFVDDDREPRVPITGSVGLKLGWPARLSFETRDGVSVHVEGSVVEPARTKAITVEEVRDHVDRMGSTPFRIDDLHIDVDDGVGMGFSAIHKLRAQAADLLQEAMLEGYHRRSLQRCSARAFSTPVRKGSCKVGVIATNPACARAAKRAGADFIYVPTLNYRRGEAVVAGQLTGTAEQAGYPKQSIPMLPVVSFSHDEGLPGGFDVWKRVREGKPVVVENLGQLIRAQELGALLEVGTHIPVTNRLDTQAMADLGVQRIWLSPELSFVQIEELGEVSPVPLGLTIMGSSELMITQHCLLMSQGPCNQNCATCARRKSPHHLKDRKGYEMPVITDAMGRSHLYNAVSLDIAHMAPELIRAGISAFMVDTTLMNVEQTTKNVKRAVRARDIALKSGDKVSKAQGATSGHLFRGVS